MTPDRWRKVNEIFHAVLDRSDSPTEEFLRAECGDDPDLYSEIRQMLREHKQTGFLDEAAWPDPDSSFARVFADGEIVSERYRIVGLLGRGGMGEVYESEDLELHEPVALKALIPAIAGDARMIARFKQEIQLSRKISHPGVCRVFDLARHSAGGSGPNAIYFLTMELLRGETLSERLRREGRS
jgi:hypothetical protein